MLIFAIIPYKLYICNMKWLFFITLIIPVIFNAQNLVPDSSFEVLKGGFLTGCWDNVADSKYWRNAVGTCDLKMEGKTNCDVGQPHSGKIYAGYGPFFSKEKKRTYEAMETKLTAPLQKGKTYNISMYVRKRFGYHFSVDCISVFFYCSSYSNGMKNILQMAKLYKNPEHDMLSDTVNWMLVSGIYQATGGETYFSIGGFFPELFLLGEGHASKMGDSTAYYHIDDVSVSADNSIPLVKTDNKPVILKNVVFETNKSVLLPESFTELDKLVTKLKADPKMKINICGHTDNIGYEPENQKLSEARAKAVYDYLISKGIDKSRLSYTGYGSSKPIADNSTETGRQANAHRVCEVAFKVFHFEKLRKQSRRHFDKHAVVQSSALRFGRNGLSETVGVVQN